MMKKDKIFRILQENIESHVPKTALKPNWNILQQDKIEVKKERSSIFRVSPAFRIVFSMAIVIALTIYGIGLFNGGITPTPPTSYTFSTDSEILTVSAVSTASLVSRNAEQLDSINQAVSMIVNLSEKTVQSIEPYLEMIETIASQNQDILVTTLDSDRAEFASKATIISFDLLGNQVIYTMYYNTLSYEADKDEKTFEIEGIFIIKLVEYEFVGKKEIDDDGEKLSFKSSTDENNYVESVYKVENDESKYTIKVVENGILVSENKIKIEIEDNEKKIKFEYADGNNSGEYEFEYRFENEKNLLKIKYDTNMDGIEESGEMVVEVVVDPVSGLTSYQIVVKPSDKDEYTYEHERDLDDEDDEDEDHDEEENEDDEKDDKDKDDKDKDDEDEIDEK